MNRDGTNVTAITHDPIYDCWWPKVSIRITHPIKRTASGANKKPLIDDGQVNSKPAWSLDGTTIYFHRLVFPVTHGFSVWSIHADGSGLTEITAGQPGINEYPVN